MNNVTLKAYAKINIGLNIISNREDGYHNIETIFQQIDLYDELVLRKNFNRRISISSNNIKVPENQNNICYSAVRLVQLMTGIEDGVDISIKKRIPIGSGLGGGSSDAASVLIGLQQLWGLRLKKAGLQKLASRLGADVPFFLVGGTALGSGIGEQIKPIKLPFDYYCVIIYPNIEISSTWAYKNFNFNLTKTKKCIKLSHIFSNRFQQSNLKNIIQNDLEEVVFQTYPVLKEIKQLLYRKGAFLACMSGSGSTVYGLFQNYSDVVVMRSILKPCQIILAKPMITKNNLY